MSLDERLERLAGIVESSAASVVARDNQIGAHTRQIGALIEVAARHQKQIDALVASTADLEKQWQAYIRRLPRN
jgi:ABC-type transporter Mla subunit MlaD